MSQEWQTVIESALRTMDVMVALAHEGFCASPWTQQEVGWALGRGVPVLFVRLGEDPKGFPGRWQAPSPTREAAAVASRIAVWLTEQPEVGPVVLERMLWDLAHAPSYKAAEQAALRFEEMGKLGAAVLDGLAAAYHANDQIPGHIGARVIKRIFAAHRREWPPPTPVVE